MSFNPIRALSSPSASSYMLLMTDAIIIWVALSLMCSNSSTLSDKRQKRMSGCCYFSSVCLGSCSSAWHIVCLKLNCIFLIPQISQSRAHRYLDYCGPLNYSRKLCVALPGLTYARMDNSHSFICEALYWSLLEKCDFPPANPYGHSTFSVKTSLKPAGMQHDDNDQRQ